MSNHLAIAAVTATLVDLLQTQVARDVIGTEVVTLRPDIAAKEQGSKVNIYLFQVTPNAAFRNIDTPTRRSDGSLIQRPQAALDLHYMISFYGNDTELVTHRQLGSVVRTLHAEPVLTREKIRQSANNRLDILGTSNLADQAELVKFSPLHLSLEEFSKIWSVMFQISYVLSVAYQGTVVLIESEDTPTSTLPVRDRNIYAVPFHQPVVEQITARLANNQEDPTLTIESNLLIKGKRLRGEVLPIQIAGAALQMAAVVRIGTVDVPVETQSVSDTEITLPLASTTGWRDGVETALATGLRAGVQGLQVVHSIAMGTAIGNPPALLPHMGEESNVASFVLHPIITNPDILAPVNGVITVTVKPLVNRRQRVVLLLNEITQPPAVVLTLVPRSRTYSFVANNSDPDNQTWKDRNGNAVTNRTKFASDDTNDTIPFTITGVVPGTYLVRIQVDGAESLLSFDANGRYDKPQVVIV